MEITFKEIKTTLRLQIFVLIMIIVDAAKLIGAGLATISIAGTCVGIGLIFASLISSYSITP